jgi:hypothetical protein
VDRGIFATQAGKGGPPFLCVYYASAGWSGSVPLLTPALGAELAQPGVRAGFARGLAVYLREPHARGE